MEKIRKAVDKGNSVWIESFKMQDADMLANYFDKEGAVLGVNAKVIEGREAVRTYFKSWMAQIGPSQFALETIDLYKVKNEIYEKGSYTLTIENGNRYEGKYIVEWKQGSNGNYYFYRNIGI